MDPSKLPDWRLHRAAEVAEDVRGGPGGISAKAGDLVVVMTETQSSHCGRVSFPVVSPYRLALSIAIGASHAATQLWQSVAFPLHPRGGTRTIDFRTTPQLYDFFEQAMIAATFSFQSLEAFANQVIDEHLEEGRTLTLKRRKGEQGFDSNSLQRDLSTEEKLASVLPILFRVDRLPKGQKLWQRFAMLKRVRDSTIHLKARDHYIIGDLDKETLFYKLLNHGARSFPRVSLDLMTYFNGGKKPTWLEYAEQQLANPIGLLLQPGQLRVSSSLTQPSLNYGSTL